MANSCPPWIESNEAQEALSRFADHEAARRALLRLWGDADSRAALAGLLPRLLTTLSTAASPDQALVSLERFFHSAADRPGALQYLADHPRAVEILVTLFAGSQYLTEILLRNPDYLTRLVEHNLAQQELDLRPPLDLDSLRRFQQWELLRIGACDLFGLLDISGVTAQLSHLADYLVRACLAVAAAQSNTPPEGFAVLALGKLGGQELNYSSDIDLLFLAAANASRYQKLGERLIEALTRITAEGFLYRVDMRLRPWGSVGALVPTLDGYMAYLTEHARLWEKQALLKARPIAGDEAVGGEFLRRIEPLLYGDSGLSHAETIRASVAAMKRLTEIDLRRQGRDWGEIKLGEGSIRDIEFVVQYLQLVHGAREPRIRSRNTLDALGRLATCGLLPADAQRVLTEGYIFLRTVEHYLQMMHYQHTHTLPDDARALTYLARRLGFQGPDAGRQFTARYEEHRAAIRAVYLQYLGGEEMKTPAERTTPISAGKPDPAGHIARMDASYAKAFNGDAIERHATLAAQLDSEHLVHVEATPLDEGLWRVTIVGYDYPGELSLICGLLFVYGFGIVDGNVFTYEPGAEGEKRKIVDAFTVRPERGPVAADVWERYADDLAALLRLMDAGERREARGLLAKRVAETLRNAAPSSRTLYPVEIEIDNAASERYTVLHIDAPDTTGFLYELTNALAYSRIYIARVVVRSVGNRVRDTLYVTDAEGRKITDPDKQRELRAATVLIKHFTHLLPLSPDPESALLNFRGFVSQLFQQPNWPDELASLERPEVLDALARLLGVGDFLWDDFIRMQYANLFPVVRDVDALASAKSKEQLQAELEALLLPVHPGPPEPSQSPTPPSWRETLNTFKDREMFRIDMRHILGHTREFWEFSEELTDLTEVVVNAAYHLCHEDLRAVYGSPRLENGDLCDMTVCALGKCGGREMGFASDVELMFLYAGNGLTDGPQVIANAEFYEKLVQTFIGAIRAKREGVFEIDLQLRPYGKAGSLAVSLEAFRRYFAPDGPAWPYERQALVKLRPIAGNAQLGQEVTALRDAFVYTGEPFNIAAMRAMRERQVRHLVAGGTFNAKFSPGGLADLEYIVQGLQITYGGRDPSLRSTNTREAMAALAAAGILSPDDYTRLRKAHTFLRWLIDALRMVRGNAKDLTVPPPDSEEFAFLAHRLRYGDDTDRLRQDLARHTAAVQELSARLLALSS